MTYNHKYCLSKGRVLILKLWVLSVGLSVSERGLLTHPEAPAVVRESSISLKNFRLPADGSFLNFISFSSVLSESGGSVCNSVALSRTHLTMG